MPHEKLGCRPLPAYIPQSFYDIHTEEGTAQALYQIQQCQDSSINIKTLPGCRKTWTQMKLNLISTIPVQICLMKMANPSNTSHYVICLRTPEESILHLPVSSWQDWWRYSGLNHSLLHVYTHHKVGFENTWLWQHMQRCYRPAPGNSVSHTIEH